MLGFLVKIVVILIISFVMSAFSTGMTSPQSDREGAITFTFFFIIVFGVLTWAAFFI